MTLKRNKHENELGVFWVIRNTITKKYCAGGTFFPRWNNQGRMFQNHKTLLNYINKVNSYWELAQKSLEENKVKNGYYYPSYYLRRLKGKTHPLEDCEVVQMKRIEEGSLPVKDYGK